MNGILSMSIFENRKGICFSSSNFLQKGELLANRVLLTTGMCCQIVPPSQWILASGVLQCSGSNFVQSFYGHRRRDARCPVRLRLSSCSLPSFVNLFWLSLVCCFKRVVICHICFWTSSWHVFLAAQTVPNHPITGILLWGSTSRKAKIFKAGVLNMLPSTWKKSTQYSVFPKKLCHV